MKHVKRTSTPIYNSLDFNTVDEWKLVRPRDKNKPNFFYSYDNAKDAMLAAQRGEVPQKGVTEFMNYGRMLHTTALLQYFETQRECEYANMEEDDEEQKEDDETKDMVVCFICEQVTFMPRCCRYHPSSAYCLDLKCVLSRHWADINKVVRREWAAFYGDRDPLCVDGVLLADLPSVQNPADYGQFTLNECIPLNDEEYAY